MLFYFPLVLSILSTVNAQGLLAIVSAPKGRPRAPDPAEAGTRNSLPTPFRRLSSANPITDVTSKDISCGIGSQPGQSDLAVAAGDPLMFLWTQADDTRLPWNYTIGPIISYISPCGHTACSIVDPSQASWYKFDQQGLKAGGGWVQEDLASLTNPAVPAPNVPKGEYLIRQEVVDLSNAGVPNGANFYVGCIQVSYAKSSKTAALPNAQGAITLPGAYNAQDPGILVPDLNDLTADTYIFPGGPVLNFGAAAARNATATTTSSTTSTLDTASQSSSLFATINATATSTSLATATATDTDTSSALLQGIADGVPGSVTSVFSTTSSAVSSGPTAPVVIPVYFTTIMTSSVTVAYTAPRGTPTDTTVLATSSTSDVDDSGASTSDSDNFSSTSAASGITAPAATATSTVTSIVSVTATGTVAVVPAASSVITATATTSSAASTGTTVGQAVNAILGNLVKRNEHRRHQAYGRHRGLRLTEKDYE